MKKYIILGFLLVAILAFSSASADDQTASKGNWNLATSNKREAFRAQIQTERATFEAKLKTERDAFKAEIDKEKAAFKLAKLDRKQQFLANVGNMVEQKFASVFLRIADAQTRVSALIDQANSDGKDTTDAKSS